MFKLEIKTGGAAFRDEAYWDENSEAPVDPCAAEVRRLLLKVERELAHGYNSGCVMDINGNKVGQWSYD